MKGEVDTMLEDELNGNILGNPQTIKKEINPCVITASLSSGSSGSMESFTTVESKKSINEFEGKKLNRGISRATDNVNLVSQARCEIIVDSSENQYFIETPVYTFALPDLSTHSDDFRLFLEKDLIALSTQLSLEQANRLNWWTPHCQKLWPLSTSGDGNCLLHAASLGMWGFHDRLLTLRKALHEYLTCSPRKEAIWRRWRKQQSALNAQAGLLYSEVEWRQEWNAIVNMASTEPRLRRLSIHSDHGGENIGTIYESLEEIHVLALAHVLRRSIIVVADTVLKDMRGEALAPIPFGGIYLPVECSPEECHRAPLLLAYDGGHFSALVSMDSPSNANSCAAIPLTDINGDLLPLQFSVDPGASTSSLDQGATSQDSLELTHGQRIDLLSMYLDIIRIDPIGGGSNEDSGKSSGSGGGLLGSFGKSVEKKLRLKLGRSNSQRKTMICAVLHSDKRHEYHDTMIKNYLESAHTRFQLHCIENNKVIPEEGSLRYGAGNSQFYTEADAESHQRVSLLKAQPLTRPNSTLYLSNSTFYEDTKLCKAPNCQFFGNPQTFDYCSKCYKLLDQGGGPPLD